MFVEINSDKPPQMGLTIEDNKKLLSLLEETGLVHEAAHDFLEGFPQFFSGMQLFMLRVIFQTLENPDEMRKFIEQHRPNG